MVGEEGLLAYPKDRGGEESYLQQQQQEVPNCMFFLKTGTCAYGNRCRYNHPANAVNATARVTGYQLPAAGRMKGGGEQQHPERPGQPECRYYLKTGTCKFGVTCKFHHPRGSAAVVASPLVPPPPQPQQRGGPVLNELGYPIRPGERECAYYMRTRQCRYGQTCKYHHPPLFPAPGPAIPVQPVPIPAPQFLIDGTVQPAAAWHVRPMRFPIVGPPHGQIPFLVSHPGSSGLIYPPPVGWFNPYLTSASSHPHMLFPQPHATVNAAQQQQQQQHAASSASGTFFYAQAPASTSGPATEHLSQGSGGPGTAAAVRLGPVPFMSGPASHGADNESTSFASDSVPCGPATLSHPSMPGSQVSGVMLLPSPKDQQQQQQFPERPGQPECNFYMRTGDCRYGMTCRFHHPKDRAAPKTSAQCSLSPMGLPLRPGQPVCNFYNRNGLCKFGHTCKFNHPMGGELDYDPSASSLVDMPVAPVSPPNQ